MKKWGLFKLNYCLITVLACLLACSTQNPYSRKNFGSEKAPDTYRIKKGDTLFSIAWRYGLDFKTIQSRNNIKDPNKIFVGQKLRLKSTSATRSSYNSQSKKTNYAKKTARSSPAKVARRGNWSWPIRGKILRRFNPGRIGANGIRIAGKPNQTVNAAEGGTVAYKGNGLSGYGNVVIIKHHNGLLSAYGFLSKTYVKEGQQVKKRQKIATVGYASNKQHMLHFEIRSKGKPINPLSYIGSTYHF